MKKLYGLLVLLILIAGGILGFNYIYKVSPREFISEDTIAIYALQKKISPEKYAEQAEIAKDLGYKFDVEKAEEINRYISQLYVLVDGTLLMGEINTAAVVDTGLWYPFAIKESTKYFDKDGEFYKLKPEYKQKLVDTEVFKKDLKDIYAVFHRGQIVLSENKIFLKKFIEKKSLYNAKIEEILDENKNSDFGVLVYNNSKYPATGIEAASATWDLNKREGKVDVKIYGIQDVFAGFDVQPKERKILKYADKNKLYISMENFENLEKLIFNKYIFGNKEAITMMWQGMFGITPQEILQEIDGEIILDLENESAMVLFKTDKNLSKLQDLLKIFNRNVTLKGNILIYGHDMFKENSFPYIVEDKQFVTGEFELSAISKAKELAGVDLKVKGIGNEIDLEVTVPYEKLKNEINTIK